MIVRTILQKVVMSEQTITYQASDFVGTKRREFLDAAKAGMARLRDTDGASLVMLPLSAFDMLTHVKAWATRYLQIEGALERPRAQRRAVDFGDLAWLEVFDEEDQNAFRREFQEALIRAVATDSTEPLDTCVREWRVTARALSDDARRRILTGQPSEDEFSEVIEPE